VTRLQHWCCGAPVTVAAMVGRAASSATVGGASVSSGGAASSATVGGATVRGVARVHVGESPGRAAMGGRAAVSVAAVGSSPPDLTTVATVSSTTVAGAVGALTVSAGATACGGPAVGMSRSAVASAAVVVEAESNPVSPVLQVAPSWVVGSAPLVARSAHVSKVGSAVPRAGAVCAGGCVGVGRGTCCDGAAPVDSVAAAAVALHPRHAALVRRALADAAVRVATVDVAGARPLVSGVARETDVAVGEDRGASGVGDRDAVGGLRVVGVSQVVLLVRRVGPLPGV